MGSPLHWRWGHKPRKGKLLKIKSKLNETLKRGLLDKTRIRIEIRVGPKKLWQKVLPLYYYYYYIYIYTHTSKNARALLQDV
jgi:hypothetical protein